MTDNSLFDSSFLFSQSSGFIEDLYQKYRVNPDLIPEDWSKFFTSLKGENLFKNALDNIQDNISHNISLGASILSAYRIRGHLLANLDPLGLTKVFSKERAFLTNKDLGVTFDDDNINFNFHGKSSWTLKEFISHIETIYCGNLTLEASYIYDLDEQNFLYNLFEDYSCKEKFTDQDKKYFVESLLEIENFENTIHIKFPGAKRFSCQGSESAILAIKWLIDKAALQHIDDFVIAIAHRGRLATTSCVMKKSATAIFAEFAGNYVKQNDYSLDVKYHNGFHNNYKTYFGNEVKVEMLSNPSHLEAINSVAMGYIRAKQDLNVNKLCTLGILVHGDASFAGQGVVSESLALCKIDAYETSGIIHIIINNQIGFTANANETRQGIYASEVAKSISSPILHVNGESIESVCAAVAIALEYRNRYKKDIVLDIIGYRKYGHNEGDEPFYTQPLMYEKIQQKISVGNIYAKFLVEKNVINKTELDDLTSQIKAKFERDFIDCKNYSAANSLEDNIQDKISFKTSLDIAQLKILGEKIYSVPKDFNINNKLDKLFAIKKAEILQDNIIDWASAEKLAFASLLVDNIGVRISGQDVARGTFSHRQSVIFDQITGDNYIPLNYLTKDQAKYIATNSNLSEYAALGFEYGYALSAKKTLVIWEAQFGDFANGAQIIIDQFVSSASQKWKQDNGLVMLLPHGYEGQGPEHSSARLERFLQLAAQENMRICMPSTPASYFHLLRSQIGLHNKTPLIILTPKSLLRHKLVVDKLDSLSSGKFEQIIDDNVDKKNIKKIILCSGKIYYDLFAAVTSNHIKDISLIRIEQLYPLDLENIKEVLGAYRQAKELAWCQEEPLNMGAYHYIFPHLLSFSSSYSMKLNVFSRPSAASPACGYLSKHNIEQELLVKQALNIKG